jgi:amino acid transporter
MALFDNKNIGETASPTASYGDEDFQRIDPESGVKRGEHPYTIAHS